MIYIISQRYSYHSPYIHVFWHDININEVNTWIKIGRILVFLVDAVMRLTWLSWLCRAIITCNLSTMSHKTNFGYGDSTEIRENNNATYKTVDINWQYITSLRWRHNGHDGISNHRPHQCLLNHLVRRESKKTSKLHVTGPWPVNSRTNG